MLWCCILESRAASSVGRFSFTAVNSCTVPSYRFFIVADKVEPDQSACFWKPFVCRINVGLSSQTESSSKTVCWEFIAKQWLCLAHNRVLSWLTIAFLSQLKESSFKCLVFTKYHTKSSQSSEHCALEKESQSPRNEVALDLACHVPWCWVGKVPCCVHV